MAERAHPEHQGFQEGSVYRKKLFERYAFCNQFVKEKIVLDVPCGTGWGTSLLTGAKKICGLDISAEGILYAKTHYPGIEFIQGDMASLPFSNDFFDVIICLEGFEHVEPEKGKQFIQEVKRTLKPEGLLILTCPVIEKGGQHSGNPFHITEPSEKEFKLFLIENFAAIEMRKIAMPENPLIIFVGKNDRSEI